MCLAEPRTHTHTKRQNNVMTVVMHSTDRKRTQSVCDCSPLFLNISMQAFHKSDFWSPDTANFRLRCDAEQWGTRMQFQRPLRLNEVGPEVPTGPHYLRGMGKQRLFC